MAPNHPFESSNKGNVMKQMQILFPGGKKVDASYNGFTIKTDQSKAEGGKGSAPEPFALFLASIGTCAGIYVASFLQTRDIPTDDLKITLDFKWNDKTHHLDDIAMHIQLPPKFPEAYKAAVIRTAEMCTVKKHIANPPQFSITADVAS